MKKLLLALTRKQQRRAVETRRTLTDPVGDPAQQIRHARWLIEQVAPQVASMPATAEALETARQLLGQIGGDYLDGEEATFLGWRTPHDGPNG